MKQEDLKCGSIYYILYFSTPYLFRFKDINNTVINAYSYIEGEKYYKDGYNLINLDPVLQDGRPATYEEKVHYQQCEDAGVYVKPIKITTYEIY